MAKTVETRGLFAPTPSRQESKAQTTNSASRAIVDAEIKARDAKTARLRAQRLKMEADAPPPPVKVTKKRASKA